VVATTELPDGRRIVVRHAEPDDLNGLVALYGRMSGDDRWLRFFTGGAPSAAFLRKWVSIADEGGLLLVAILEGRDGRQLLIAEAGYSLQADGDGEFGIGVDPAWRGWMGSWLLALLSRQAHARGVPNLQAVVQMANRPMLALLRRHGPAVVEQPDYSEIRLVIATGGDVPSWPIRDHRPRILIEASSGRWAGEEAARAAGFELRTCRGPDSRGRCPLLHGERCPLVDGADVIVVQLATESETTQPLLDAHLAEHEQVVFVPAPGAAGPEPCETAAEVVERIEQLLGISTPGVGQHLSGTDLDDADDEAVNEVVDRDASIER
jgi:ribosomal protein S18 acetylase RimI-like enzyme